jgi:nitroimidazol reductase NimA-like FMN-containing flavoprotein (pyridoxamine 5'-phosphate oxidase superfamily)
MMRRQEKLIEEISQINDILSKGEVIRIAMVDNGEPYIVPMSYGFKDGMIYLHCAHEGRKVSAMKANPNVCFEVSVDTKLVTKEQACGWTYQFRSVIGKGKAVMVEDISEKLVGLSAVMEQYGSTDHSFPDAAVEKTLVIRIDIEELTGKQSPAQKKD